MSRTGFADRAVDAGVVGLAAAYRAGRLDPEQACDAYLARIARTHDALGAFVAVDEGGARSAASSSAARHRAGRARGPLDGVPIAVKANIAVAGLPWTAGVGAWRERIADADARCIAELRARGVVILGTTNMDEAALGVATDNPWFGRTRNPHGTDLSAGGSSGGSAAAVAAGLCAAALGTDTMGSVRIPGAYCGVVGMVPVAGRLSRNGVAPLAGRFDRVGVLARSVADVASLLGSFDREEPSRPTAQRPFSQVAALSPDPSMSLGEDQQADYDDALERLGRTGMTIARLAVPLSLATATRALLAAVEVEAHSVYRELLDSGADGLSDGLRQMLAWGGRLPPVRRRAVDETLAAFDVDLRALLSPYDALLMPTVADAGFDAADGPPPHAAWFTSPASITGLSAATVPTTLDSRRRPQAIQIVSWSDASVMGIAARVEAACGRMPVPCSYRL